MGGFERALAGSVAIHVAVVAILLFDPPPPALDTLSERDVTFYLLHLLPASEADEAGPVPAVPVAPFEAPPVPEPEIVRAAREARRESDDLAARTRELQEWVATLSEEPVPADRPALPPPSPEFDSRLDEIVPGWRGVRYAYDIVKPRVREHLTLPDGEGEAVIQVRIGRDGAIQSLSVLHPSGVEALDDAARRAVCEAAPFPPLEDHLDAESILINCRFRFRAGLTTLD